MIPNLGMHCALCYSFCTALIKNSVNRNLTEMEKQKKLITSVLLGGNTLNKLNRALDLLKIKWKKAYPGSMEENSNYPEAIILSGESKNLKCLTMSINISYLWLNCDQGQQWTNVGFFYLASGSARPGQAATIAGDHNNGQLFFNQFIALISHNRHNQQQSQ